ncbi:MAG: ABC transporter transmembrane domain-containing protein [Magnetococcus sp. YQC-5]
MALILPHLTKKTAWRSALQAVPGYQKAVMDLVVASLVINILVLAVPFTLMQIYDRIIPNTSLSSLGMLVGGCTVAVILETILRLARFQISGWMAARFDHLSSCEALDKILDTPLPVFEQNGVGVHLERLNALNTLRTIYGGQIFQILLDIPFALLFIAVIGILNVQLMLTALLVLAIFLGCFYIFRQQFGKHRSTQVEINDRRYNFLIEILSGIHLVKAQAMEEQILRRYERLQASAAESNMSVSLWSALPINAGAFFSQAMVFALIGVGGGAVMEGQMTIGVLTAATLLGSRALQPVQQAAGFWLRFSDAEIALGQVEKMAALPSETLSGAPPLLSEIRGHLRLNGVSFRYREDTPLVVNGLNLDVPAKSMVGIRCAGSGGATTLAYLMMGILKPDSGSVLIDEYDLSEWDHRRLHGRIEYLPQYGVLFTGTILDNICMFDPKLRAAALDIAALFELDEIVATLPKGYETEVTNQSAANLPMGMVQRIALTRAFVIRPRIIIFDKANAALDQESDTVFLQFFLRMKNRSTLVLFTDHPSLLKECDRVYDLLNGQVLLMEPKP